MKTRFILQLTTGVITREQPSGTALDAETAQRLYAGDVLDCELVFKNGATDVTSTLLAGKQLKVGLRRALGEEPILALADGATVAAEVASFLLSLNTSEIFALFTSAPAPASRMKAWLEVEVAAADGSYRQTFAQQAFYLYREVNRQSDQPPAAAAVSAANAAGSAAAASASATAASNSASAAASSAAAALTSANASDASRAAAVAAQGAAESAKTAAQAAQAAAVSSASAASGAAGAAASSANNADAAAIAAVAAHAAANAAKVGAEAAFAAALASQSAAAASALAASGSASAAALSEYNATLQAAAASSYASFAAASAAAAAAALANQFLGGVAGNAVPATAPIAGNYYRITTAGTSQSKTWAAGDLAIYNGTSGSWTQIVGILPYATTAEALADVDTGKAMNAARVAERTNQGAITRATVGMMIFSPQPGGRWSAPLGVAGDVSLSPFTLTCVDIIPPQGGTISPRLAALGTTASAPLAPGLFSALDYSSGAGEWITRLYGADGASFRNIAWTGLKAAYQGKPVRWHMTWDRQSRPRMWVNGLELAATESTNGASPPAWTDVCASAYLCKGYGGSNYDNPLTGQPPMLINSVFTPAEVLLHAQTGLLPDWCAGTGSVVPVISPSILNGGFETAGGGGADAFGSVTEATLGSTLIARDTSITAGGSASCRFDVDGSGSHCAVSWPGVMRTGFGYRLRCKLRTNKPGGIMYFQYSQGTGQDAGANVPLIPVNTFGDVDFTFIAVGPNFGISRSSGAVLAGYSMWLDDVTLTPVGPVGRYIVQPGCPITVDAGDNRQHGFAIPGVTALGAQLPIIEISIPEMTADGYLYANQVIVPAGYELWSAFIERAAGASTGTITIRETSSGGTTLAAGTLGANPVSMTLTNQFSAAGKALHLSNSSWSSSTVKGRLLFRRYQ